MSEFAVAEGGGAALTVVDGGLRCWARRPVVLQKNFEPEGLLL